MNNNTNTIDTVIGKFNTLKQEEKEFTIDLLNKIFAESRRNTIAGRAGKIAANFKTGKVKQGNVNDLYNDLEND